jgi:DNA-binding transcriptional LysR family regulator
MKLYQLKFFLEVCKHNNITKAAQELHVSQPSVTSAIKKLESEFGINLFRRVNKKIYLTKEGEYLLANASSIIYNIDNLTNNLNDLANQKQHIKLGIPPMVGSYLLPIILGSFHKAHPDISIEIIEVGAIDTVVLLEKEEIDLCIVILEEYNGNLHDYIGLFDSELCFCVSKNHHFADKTIINIHETKEEPLVTFQKGYSHNKIIFKSFNENNISPNIILRTKQLSTITNMIHHNIASAFLFRISVLDDDEIVLIPLYEPMNVSVGILTKKNCQIYSDTQKLINFLKSNLY